MLLPSQRRLVQRSPVLRAFQLLLKRRVVIPQEGIIIDRLVHERLYSLWSPEVLLIERAQSGLDDPVNGGLVEGGEDLGFDVSRGFVDGVGPGFDDYKFLGEGVVLGVWSWLPHNRLWATIVQSLGQHFTFRSGLMCLFKRRIHEFGVIEFHLLNLRRVSPSSELGFQYVCVSILPLDRPPHIGQLNLNLGVYIHIHSHLIMKRRRDYSSDSEQESSTVLVLNLTLRTSEAHLREIFSLFGGIKGVNSHFRADWFWDARIEYLKTESVAKAITLMDGSKIDSNKVRVEEYVMRWKRRKHDWRESSSSSSSSSIQ